MLNSSIYRQTFDSLVWTSGSNIDQPSFDKQKWKAHLNNPSCPNRREHLTFPILKHLGPVTQKMVKVNPGLSPILSKVFLSKNHVTRAYKNSLMPLLTKKEMITQNGTLSNA